MLLNYSTSAARRLDLIFILQPPQAFAMILLQAELSGEPQVPLTRMPMHPASLPNLSRGLHRPQAPASSL